jgi:PTH1 family peptidyl-tRNA hydrolase
MEPYLIVGLGNPGKSYANHRHNIGFQVVEILARRHGLKFDRNQQQAEVASGVIGGHKVLLAKPQTFMNRSGVSVRGLVNFYKLPLTNLLVIADHLDLEFAKLRFRPNGSSGGQNGLKSIIAELGTQEFPRLMVGIGRPPGRMDPAAYVLPDYSAEQETEMAIVRQEAADGVELWMKEGLLTAMNKVNGKGGTEKAASAKPKVERKTPPAQGDGQKAESKKMDTETAP